MLAFAAAEMPPRQAPPPLAAASCRRHAAIFMQLPLIARIPLIFAASHAIYAISHYAIEPLAPLFAAEIRHFHYIFRRRLSRHRHYWPLRHISAIDDSHY